MKKLFFTAIALVAFSGVSLANTKDVIKKYTNHKTEKKEVVKTNPCSQLASDSMASLEDCLGCLDSTTYNSIYTIIYNNCMKG